MVKTLLSFEGKNEHEKGERGEKKRGKRRGGGGKDNGKAKHTVWESVKMNFRGIPDMRQIQKFVLNGHPDLVSPIHFSFQAVQGGALLTWVPHRRK